MSHELTKPTQNTSWATLGGALKTDGGVNRQTLGWQTLPSNAANEIGERPNLNEQNFWQNAVGVWLDYFETFTDELDIPSHQTRVMTKFQINDVDQTLINVGADTFTRVDHGFHTGDKVQFQSDTTISPPLVNFVNYYIIKIDDDTFQAAVNGADALAGTQINITGQGTGTMQLDTNSVYYLQPSDRFTYYVVDSTNSIGVTIFLPSMDLFTADDDSKVFNIIKTGPYNNEVNIVPAANNFIGPTGVDSVRLKAPGDNLVVMGTTIPVGTRDNGDDFWQWKILNLVCKDTFDVRTIEDYAVVSASTEFNFSENSFYNSNTQLYTGDKIQLTTSGTLPAGLSLATDYYIIRLTASLYQLAQTFNSSRNGSVKEFTDQGTGNHTLTSQQFWTSQKADGFRAYQIVTGSLLHTLTLQSDIEGAINNIRVIKKGLLGQVFIDAGNEKINGENDISLYSDNAVTNLTGDSVDEEWTADFEEIKLTLSNNGSQNIDASLHLSKHNGLTTLGWTAVTHDLVNSAFTTAVIPARFQPKTNTFTTTLQTFGIIAQVTVTLAGALGWKFFFLGTGSATTQNNTIDGNMTYNNNL